MSDNRWEKKYNELKALTEQQIEEKIRTYKYYSNNPRKIPEGKVAENKLKDKDGKPLPSKDKYAVLKGTIDKDLLTLESFQKNKDKIERYIKYRDNLHLQIAKMNNGPLASVIKMEQLKKQKKEIEAKITTKMAELNTESKKNKKDPKKIAKINKEITKLAGDKQKNVQLNIECSREIREMQKNGINGMPFDPKNMMKTLKDMQAATVKCDMLCALLMQGKGINDLHFDKTKAQYKAPKRIEELINNNKEPEKQPQGQQAVNEQVEPEKQPQGQQAVDEEVEPEQTTPETDQENSLIKRARFSFRHPIQSIKNILQERKNRKNEQPEPEENEAEEHNSGGETHNNEENVNNIGFKELQETSRLFLENDKFVEDVGNQDDFKNSLKVRRSENNLDQIAKMYDDRAKAETDPNKKKVWEAKRDEYLYRSKNAENSGLTAAIKTQDETQKRVRDDGSR